MVLTIVGVFITNIVMSLNTALHRGGREGVGYSWMSWRDQQRCDAHLLRVAHMAQV